MGDPSRGALSLDTSNLKRSGEPVFEFVCIFGHDELGVSLFIRPVCQTPAEFDSTFKRPLERCKLLTRWAFEYFDQTGPSFGTGRGPGRG